MYRTSPSRPASASAMSMLPLCASRPTYTGVVRDLPMARLLANSQRPGRPSAWFIGVVRHASRAQPTRRRAARVHEAILSRTHMPYVVSFVKFVQVTDPEQYINDCCVGGDIVLDRLLPALRDATAVPFGRIRKTGVGLPGLSSRASSSQSMFTRTITRLGSFRFISRRAGRGSCWARRFKTHRSWSNCAN
jgi:hypothetical protein